MRIITCSMHGGRFKGKGTSRVMRGLLFHFCAICWRDRVKCERHMINATNVTNCTNVTKLAPAIALLIFALLTCCGLAHAQKNDVGVFGVGVFNPSTVVYINVNQQMISSNRSAAGGGLSYRRWFTKHNAFGAEGVLNPSGGKLVYYSTPTKFGGYTVTGTWPQLQSQVLGEFTQRAWLNSKLALLLQEGAGVNLTDGYSNSGWSHDAAYAEGTGFDFGLSKHVAFEIRGTWLETETGCYNGRDCKQTFGVVSEGKAGVVFGF